VVSRRRLPLSRITWFACVAVGLYLAPAAVRAQPIQVPASALDGESVNDAITSYCVTCHNDHMRTAGLTLSGVQAGHLRARVPLFEKVLHKLRAGEMPPVGRPRPDEGTMTGLVRWLELELDRAATERPDPGAPAIHRLNKAEYRNAVRDLLGLDLDHAEDLPTDDSGYGFDNISDVLTVSPLHIEKYLSTARRISRLAVGTGTPRPVVQRFTAPRGSEEEVLDGLPPNVRGGILFHHVFPFDAEYRLTVRVRGRRAIGMPAPRLDLRVDGVRARLFEADFDGEEANQGTRNFEVPLTVSAGRHEVATGFLTEYARNEGTSEGGANRFFVDYVLVGGPYNPTGPGDTESRRRIFGCRPAEGYPVEPCAREILTRLARRAYRRPVDRQDIEPLMTLFEQGYVDGGSFDHGVEMALSGLLVSPGFLFRAPSVPTGAEPGSVYPLTDIDLASRLSFFLWSSMPDDELLRLAEEERLNNPAVLETQILRMMTDRRSEALVENFGGQWLHLRNVADWTPDPERFEHFDDAIRRRFQRETELFLRYLIREDRSVLELIDADYSFLDERLAEFYGVEGVHGAYFRRVSLAGTPRRGILTHGSVLMVTSYPTRTSPVLRGKWVLENLLGAPPPPPPPDVPALTDRAESSASGLREALEQHRANPACAVCHARLDPLGFALERFDAVGAYRSEDGGVLVEASGALPDGTLVAGVSGLRTVLHHRRQEFVESLAGKLLTYAIGRGVESHDRAAVREIRRRVETNDYRFSALVRAIVDSVPFRLRRVPE